MTIDYLKKLLNGNNAIKITDDLIIDNPDVKNIIENTAEFYVILL